MKILFVCSGNSGSANPFVKEQAAQLQSAGMDVSIFLIKGKGALGYLRNLPAYRAAIQSFKPDVVHAHGGMSALLAALQRIVPVVVTFHGSDVNVPSLRKLARLSVLLTKHQIVVSQQMKNLLNNPLVYVIPCAVEPTIFQPMDYDSCRRQLKWLPEEFVVLFSSSFDRPVKNAPLARQAVEGITIQQVRLVELKGKSREEVAMLLNACDVALMTSYTEGSPQFIKEAMACGTPIVSTRVGDVPELIEGLPGHYLIDYDARLVGESILRAVEYRREYRLTGAREILEKRGLFPPHVVNALVEVYTSCL
jgi:glycosyltransferase involved in cell wall biosynthesis